MRKLSYFRYLLINLAMIMGIVGYLQHEKTLEYFSWAREIFFHRDASIAQRQKETREAFVIGLKPYLEHLAIDESSAVVKLVAFKDAKILYLFAGNSEDNLKYVKSYPIKAASGVLGPKLVEGDRQVPEGIYNIEYLNPNSLYFLSMKLTYPNDFEKEMALKDQRISESNEASWKKLGSDIMIHGKDRSIGCLALGDQAISELFHLATLSQFEKWTVIIAPTDLRNGLFPQQGLARAEWVKDLYMNLKTALMQLPWPAEVSTAATND